MQFPTSRNYAVEIPTFDCNVCNALLGEEIHWLSLLWKISHLSLFNFQFILRMCVFSAEPMSCCCSEKVSLHLQGFCSVSDGSGGQSDRQCPQGRGHTRDTLHLQVSMLHTYIVPQWIWYNKSWGIDPCKKLGCQVAIMLYIHKFQRAVLGAFSYFMRGGL